MDTIGSMGWGETAVASRWALWVPPTGEAWLHPGYWTRSPSYYQRKPSWITVSMTEQGCMVVMPNGLRVPHTWFNPWRGPSSGYFVGDLVRVVVLNGRTMANSGDTQRLEPKVAESSLDLFRSFWKGK